MIKKITPGTFQSTTSNTIAETAAIPSSMTNYPASFTSGSIARRKFLKAAAMTMGAASLPWGAVSLGAEFSTPKREKRNQKRKVDSNTGLSVNLPASGGQAIIIKPSTAK